MVRVINIKYVVEMIWRVITIILLLILIVLHTIDFETKEIVICTEYTSSETKALCDKDNFCRDYIMYYKGNKLVDIEPTEYTLQR